jgi:hypothetical protein
MLKKERTPSRERHKREEKVKTEGGFGVISSEDNTTTDHVIGQAT